MLRVSTNFWPKVYRNEILFWESKPLGWWEKKCKDFLPDINQRKSLVASWPADAHHSCIFFSLFTISVPLGCLWAHQIWWSHKICMLTLKSKPYTLRKEKGRKREKKRKEGERIESVTIWLVWKSLLSWELGTCSSLTSFSTILSVIMKLHFSVL